LKGFVAILNSQIAGRRRDTLKTPELVGSLRDMFDEVEGERGSTQLFLSREISIATTGFTVVRSSLSV